MSRGRALLLLTISSRDVTGTSICTPGLIQGSCSLSWERICKDYTRRGSDMQGIYANSVIEWAGTPHPRYDRILRIESASATVTVIDVTDTAGDDSVNPVFLPHEALEEALNTSKARLVDEDPYTRKLRPKVELTAQEKTKVEKIWKVIEPIVTH